MQEQPSEIISHSDLEHKELGGSGAHRWVKCGMSITLARGLKKETPGPQAVRGTKIHEIGEIALRDWINYRLTGSDPDIRLKFLTDVDDDMIQMAISYREHIWEKLFSCNIADKIAWGVEDEFIFDERFDSGGRVDAWGIEIDARAKRTGLIGDLKTGYPPIDPKDNPQLAFYACALQSEVRRHGKDLDQVRAAIFQPRRADGKIYQEHLFTSSSLERWRKKFLKAADLIYIKKKPKYKLGDHCQYCPARGICKEYAKELQTEHARVFNAPAVTVLPDIQQISDAEILKIWQSEDKIQGFLKAVRNYIMQRAQEGNDIPGIKVVEGRSRRIWSQDLGHIKHSLDQLGLTNYSTEKLLALTKVEAMLTKQYGRKEAKMYMEPLVSHSRPSLNIVSEDDPRPKVATLTSVFTSIEEKDEDE